MKKRSKLQALLEGRCPRCREGKMFEHAAYSLKFTKMNETCPHCNLRYNKEPGFFDGAMYVSYAMSVGIVLVTGFVLYNFFGDPDVSVYITTVITVNILLVPLLYRFSRIIYMHIFGGVSYQPELAEKNEK